MTHPLRWLLVGMIAFSGADGRPPTQILDEIHAVAPTDAVPEGKPSKQALKEAANKKQAASNRKAKLIRELAQADPTNPELAQLLPERWSIVLRASKGTAEVAAEAAQVITQSKDLALVTEAHAIRVRVAIRKAATDPKAKDLAAAIDDFIRSDPRDERGGAMLATLARATKDKAKKAAILQRIEQEYPEVAARQAAGTVAADSDAALGAARQSSDMVGKPFPINFIDAIRGRRVTSASLKGKVVVVDFWATWCGPCVAEMPKMKELYAKYRAQGVEFVGISLDSAPDAGGYDELAKFVASNRIEWPQFYQGNGWESDFSRSCGIRSIPSVFLVAADGTLASTDARGKLDQMIPEYLEKAKAKKVAAAQP